MPRQSSDPFILYSHPISPPERIMVRDPAAVGHGRLALMSACNLLGDVPLMYSVQFLDSPTVSTSHALVPPAWISAAPDPGSNVLPLVRQM